MISGFRTAVDENCALLGYYTSSSGNSSPTFRDNLLVPSSRVENGCPATSVMNYTTRYVITQKTADVTPKHISLNFISPPPDTFLFSLVFTGTSKIGLVFLPCTIILCVTWLLYTVGSTFHEAFLFQRHYSNSNNAKCIFPHFLTVHNERPFCVESLSIMVLDKLLQSRSNPS